MFKSAEYPVALLKLLDSLPGGRGTTRQVIDLFGQRYHDQIPPAHFRENALGRIKWRHTVHWSRNKLKGLGLVGGRRGEWEITPKGHRWLTDHPGAIRLVDSDTMTPNGGAESEEESPSQEPFLETLAFLLADSLPDAVRNLNPSFTRRRNLLQMRLASPTGCHYEIRLCRTYHEIGLHFESSQRRNEMRLKAFMPHIEALQDELGQPVHAESWGQNWARVWLKLSPEALTDALAKQYCEHAVRFIAATLPILDSTQIASQSLVRRTKATTGSSDNRQSAILDEEIAAVRAFVEGRTAHSPTDEKLCDWVRFCYTFELYAEGRDLFRCVKVNCPNEWYYNRTKKLAQICSQKASGNG